MFERGRRSEQATLVRPGLPARHGSDDHDIGKTPRAALAVLLAAIAAHGAPAHGAEFKARLDSFLYGSAIQISDSSLNPNNLIFEAPEGEGAIDLRPDLSVVSDQTRWVLRPRWIGSYAQWSEHTESGWQTYGRYDSKLTLSDAYTDWRFGDQFATSLGLQVYQWGPGELMNASNPLFHLSTSGRSAFFKEKGKVLARASFDTSSQSSPQWNVMLIANPLSNNEPEWRAEQKFSPSAMLKIEARSTSGSSFLGVIGGSEGQDRAFGGEYANITAESGWSLYLDARHTSGQKRFTPAVASTGAGDAILVRELESQNSLDTLLLTGVRWEGRVDLRAEYFYNSLGYTPNEWLHATASVAATEPARLLNLSRIVKPGLELLGQHYAYLSARIPDFGPKKDMQFFLRSLISIQDGSSILQTLFEKPFGDSMVLDIEGSVSIGDENLELTTNERARATVGLKWTL